MSSGELAHAKKKATVYTSDPDGFPPSFFMLSLASVNSYYQLFLAQGVGLGLGAGLIYMPSMAIQAHYWRRRRALVMGIVITGTAFFLLLIHLHPHNSSSKQEHPLAVSSSPSCSISSSTALPDSHGGYVPRLSWYWASSLQQTV